LAIGGFSKVYLARSYEDGRFYAIKFIKKKAEKNDLNRAAVINEMEICSQLNHPFLVKMK
jgi:serine/threonine protein kinase